MGQSKGEGKESLTFRDLSIISVEQHKVDCEDGRNIIRRARASATGDCKQDLCLFNDDEKAAGQESLATMVLPLKSTTLEPPVKAVP
jgi:hypothetical protein